MLQTETQISVMLQNPFDEIAERLSSVEHCLLEIKNALKKDNVNQPEADQLLTIKEAAEFLKLSVPTLYGKVHDKDIPVCKKGNRLYFSKQELSDWIKTGRKKTSAEIATEADAYITNHRRKK
jgi:excisionase family DNA binding protein